MTKQEKKKLLVVGGLGAAAVLAYFMFRPTPAVTTVTPSQMPAVSSAGPSDQSASQTYTPVSALLPPSTVTPFPVLNTVVPAVVAPVVSSPAITSTVLASKPTVISPMVGTSTRLTEATSGGVPTIVATQKAQ